MTTPSSRFRFASEGIVGLDDEVERRIRGGRAVSAMKIIGMSGSLPESDRGNTSGAMVSH
jgi:hypothetical protein